MAVLVVPKSMNFAHEEIFLSNWSENDSSNNSELYTTPRILLPTVMKHVIKYQLNSALMKYRPYPRQLCIEPNFHM